jgi:hypothetical protein
MTSNLYVRSKPRHPLHTPSTVIPAKAGIQVGVHGNGQATGRADHHVGHHRRTRAFSVLCGGTNLDPGLRRDDGGEGVPGLAATAPDINGAVRGWPEG